MLRVLLLLSVAVVLCAGCGDTESPTKRSAHKQSRDQATKTTGNQDASYRASNALALSTNLLHAAKFCVRKIGSEQGVEEPPSAVLREAKDRLVTNARLVARDMPDLRIGGKPLSQFLDEAATTMRNGQCDPRAAAALDDLALRVP